jgi:tRNA(Ile2) C34 agmatinyltransferase TiaS
MEEENNSPHLIEKVETLGKSVSHADAPSEGTFNLSDKIILPRTEDDFTVLSYHDVKEFIHRVKDLCNKYYNRSIYKNLILKEIDKLAGDDLIDEKMEKLSLCPKCHCMTKSIVVNRANWRCGKCKADKTLSDVFFEEAVNKIKEEE